MYERIILISILGFFSGSVLYGKVLPMAICGIDIETVSEDGNPGTSNVFKYCGMKCGIPTAILEFAKGFFPIILGNCLVGTEQTDSLFWLIIIAPVLGHMFSVFHHWNGGLGVATTFGTLFAVFLDCKLIFFLVGIYAIARFALKFKHNYQRTVTAFSCFIVLILIFEKIPIYRDAYVLISAVICCKAIITEMRNQRGEETTQTSQTTISELNHM